MIDWENITLITEPRYFIKNKLAHSSQRSYDKELGYKLWAISETLTQGIK